MVHNIKHIRSCQDFKETIKNSTHLFTLPALKTNVKKIKSPVGKK